MEFIVVCIVAGVLVIFGNRQYQKHTREQTFIEFQDAREEEVKELEGHYEKICKTKEIDEQVLVDLQMEEIFNHINHTYTTIGLETLYSRMRHYQSDANEWEELIASLDTKNKIVDVIMALQKLEKQYQNNLDMYEHMDLQSYFIPFTKYLRFVPILTLLAIPLIGIVPFVGSMLLNTVIGVQIEQKMDRIYTDISNFQLEIDTLKKISETVTLPTTMQKNVTTILDTFYRPLSIVRLENRIRYYDFLYLFSVVTAFTFLNIIQYTKAKQLLIEHQNQFIQTYEYLGKIDAALSVFSFRNRVDTYCLPTYTNTKEVKIEDGYHLLITNPVTNNCHIQRNCIITGSNASGKSTFMKMVGLQMYLGQTIHTCLAKSCVFYPFTLLSTMRIQDNIIAGDSYYIREIKLLKEMLLQSQKGECFIFIDEILRGTNEIERVAIGTSIISALCQASSLFMLSTHDVKMALQFKEQCDMYCLHYVIEGDTEIVTYKLEKGICHIGNALSLLHIHEYDENIIQEAKERLQSYYQT